MVKETEVFIKNKAKIASSVSFAHHFNPMRRNSVSDELRATKLAIHPKRDAFKSIL